MKFYSDSEKEILVNHFILHKNNSNINFKNYLEKYIQENGTQLQPDSSNLYKHTIYANLNNWQYNTHNLLWDDKDNAITYILKHVEFRPTIAMLGDLRKLEPDWNYTDFQGNGALHLLALKGDSSVLKKALKVLPINPDLGNNIGDPFTFLLLKGFKNTINQLPTKFFLTRELGYLQFVNELWKTHTQHFSLASKEQLGVLAEDLVNAKELLAQHCHRHRQLMNPREEELIESYFFPLEKTVSYYRLNQELPVKPASIRKKI